MKLIIMAGGQGTKIWPYSRESYPKQFQPILGKQSLFQWQIETLLQKFSAKDIYVSTKLSYMKYAIDQGPEIPPENFIREPDIKKNQGPGTALAAMKIMIDHEGEPFMLIQSDCLRTPKDKYLDMIDKADELIRDRKTLISVGYRPTYPAMGCDYFELDKQVSKNHGLEVYSVEKFLGRSSDIQKTREMIENFHVVIHANHVAWYPELMLESFKELKPNWYETSIKIRDILAKGGDLTELTNAYKEYEAGPMEDVTKEVFEKEGLIIIPQFKWTDIGTWGSIYEYFAKAGGNYTDGNIIAVDTSTSLIKGNNGKLIATLGVKDLVVVDTNDVLLICDRENANNVKKILDELEKRKMSEYL